ncbi:MAG: LON peptidase substrate-binding domain-containing protein, partial [Bacteroidota bacterium]
MGRPLFPLKLVVYPGEQLNLHIFEPRYKQLIRECEQNKVTFGIPAFIND